MMRIYALVGTLLSFSFFHLPAKDPKLSPEEVVSRHLASIGKIEALQKARSRAINGTAQATIQVGGAGQVNGQVSILSNGSQIRMGMVFPVPEYPGEQFAYDGKQVSAGTLVPGIRSVLTSFVYHNDSLLKEGILGGVLTTAWPLLAVEAHQPRLSYSGLQKGDGRSYHTLKYRPRRGGMDVAVMFYFDPETFRHVRTDSELEIGAQIVPDINQSARQHESRYKLVEEYSDFREEAGLMLPHKYRMQYSILTTGRGQVSTWTLTLDQFVENPHLDESYFKVR